MDIFLASIGIFLGEMYGNFVGGGSIVTQFFLQSLIGIDIKNAIALDNAAVLGSELGLLIMLLRKEKIKKWMFLLVVCGILGAIGGAYLLNIVSSELLKITFTIILFLVVLNSIFGGGVSKKEEGFEVTNKNILLLSTAIFLIAVYNAFMSIGDFIIGLLVLTTVFHFKYHRAIFILTLSWVFVRTTASIEYYRYGLLDMNFVVPMFFSAMLAGIIVGYLIYKIKSEVLEKLLKVVGVVLAIYLGINLFI